MTTAQDVREAFRPDTTRGRLAIATSLLVVISPALATFVSPWFLVLLAVALAFSFVGLLGSGTTGRSTRLARAGYAMAVNGVVLIVALFVDGFLGDFVISARHGLGAASVGAGFTTVHILLGVGLLVVDDHRHARRQDI